MRKGVGIVVGLAALALAAVVAVRILGGQGVPFLAADVCRAEVGGRSVSLDPQQARYAGLITAVSVERGMPARAATIALATAYQESELRNLEGGDRDSVGLFQQRPSMGWGTKAQLRDPVYSANAFYDALAEVDGYTQLPVTEAAQAVQRSAFPAAYADHEADARVLASALTGNSPGTFSCRLDDATEGASLALRASGLTGRADAVRREVLAVFPGTPMGGFEPGGVGSGHMEGSAHYDGRAVDAFVRPISAVNRTRGWAIAAYMVSQADRLHIKTVIFDGRIWTAGARSGQGWRDYTVPASSRGDRAILEHRDHVHVDVYA